MGTGNERNALRAYAKPIIGVTPLWDVQKQSVWMLPGYMKGIENAGGLPLVLPLTNDSAIIRQIAAHFDGFLFTGGQDVDPKIYGEETLSCCGEISPERDTLESILFTEAVITLDKPALGICRGIQFFNAFLGGTLYQDIPSQLGKSVSHSQKPSYDTPIHEVSLVKDLPLAKLLEVDNLAVNSLHHQGVKDCAQGFVPMAYAPDGLIEAGYMPDRKFVWAVQWHPEFALEWESSKQIFNAFIKAT